MIGIIQHILIKLVRDEFGQDIVDTILSKVNLPSGFQFRIDTNYSDEEFQLLFRTCCETAGWDEQEACERYAVYFLKEAKQLFPQFFLMSKTSKELLLQQPSIHNSLGAGLKDKAEHKKVADKFRVEEDGNSLLVYYKSPNQLCPLYIALANAVMEEYEEKGIVESLTCTRDGDEECKLRVSWENQKTK